jgi:hypothetical protein
MRARQLATTLAGVTLSIALLPGQAASSSGGAAGANVTSEANLSGAPVVAKDEMTALCKQIVEQALTVEAAQALADASGYITRVGKLDGVDQAVTADAREDRFTFDVAGGVVTGCTVG